MVEVARHNATVEPATKAAMPKGTIVPQGRLRPQEVKPQPEEISVFTEGRQADGSSGR